jgi:hypothetical protein
MGNGKMIVNDESGQMLDRLWPTLMHYSKICLEEQQGPFEMFLDWWQRAAVMQREAVTVMPSGSGRDNVVVA